MLPRTGIDDCTTVGKEDRPASRGTRDMSHMLSITYPTYGSKPSTVCVGIAIRDSSSSTVYMGMVISKSSPSTVYVGINAFVHHHLVDNAGPEKPRGHWESAENRIQPAVHLPRFRRKLPRSRRISSKDLPRTPRNQPGTRRCRPYTQV